MEQNTIDEGKTAAIVSYIFTPIGLLVAYILNNTVKNEFANFHIGQSVRLAILGVANWALAWLLPGFLSLVSTAISVGILVLMILGIMNAVNGKKAPLPLIGTLGGN